MRPAVLRRVGCSFVVVTMALACVTSAAAQEQSVADSRLKAAIVSRFPEFVHWPPGALADHQALTLCVTHRSTFAEHLGAVVAGVHVQGHPLVVRVLDDPDGVYGCHVLFVAADSPFDHAELLAAAAPLPVLTVGDDRRCWNGAPFSRSAR
jgi:hypothetical protein